MEGNVRVVKLAANGRQQLLSIERAGRSLAEVSAFDGGPYSATGVSITPTVLLRLRGEHFRSLCLAHPAVALKVIRVFGHRLRTLRRLVEEPSFETVRNRLILHLLNLAGERGCRGGVMGRAKQRAADENIALRDLLVRALNHYLAGSSPRANFKLRWKPHSPGNLLPGAVPVDRASLFKAMESSR